MAWTFTVSIPDELAGRLSEVVTDLERRGETRNRFVVEAVREMLSGYPESFWGVSPGGSRSSVGSD